MSKMQPIVLLSEVLLSEDRVIEEVFGKKYDWKYSRVLLLTILDKLAYLTPFQSRIITSKALSIFFESDDINEIVDDIIDYATYVNTLSLEHIIKVITEIGFNDNILFVFRRLYIEEINKLVEVSTTTNDSRLLLFVLCNCTVNVDLLLNVSSSEFDSIIKSFGYILDNLNEIKKLVSVILIKYSSDTTKLLHSTLNVVVNMNINADDRDYINRYIQRHM